MTFFARGTDTLIGFASSHGGPGGSQSWMPRVKAPRVVFDVGCALGCSLVVGPKKIPTDAFDIALVCVGERCGLSTPEPMAASDNTPRDRKGVGRIVTALQ